MTSILRSPGFLCAFLPILLFQRSHWSRSSLWSPVPLVYIPPFEDSSKDFNYNWYHRHFHILRLFFSLARCRYFSLAIENLWEVNVNDTLLVIFKPREKYCRLMEYRTYSLNMERLVGTSLNHLWWHQPIIYRKIIELKWSINWPMSPW